jgi:WD40 repeat protein
VASGALAGAFADPASRGVNGVAFGPGGAMLAAADGNGQVCLWDVAGGGLARAFPDPASRGVNGVAFAPAGDLLATADGNGCTYLWQISPRAT